MERVKEPVKEERDVLVIACTKMAGVSPAVAATSLQAQHPSFPTPSPFSFSAASTRSRWSSRPSIRHSNLFLRFLALVFSFASALSLAAQPQRKKGKTPDSFTEYPELMYCFIVAIIAFLYSAFQLFKGVCDIAHRGFLISDMVSDYLSFILDQLVGYLLVSSSSVAIPVIQVQLGQNAAFRKGAIISASTSFATFLVVASSALFSGYKLCKRIMW